ncbi:MAG: hypothetical protein HYX78_13010 [Armatimonadetes bacterium]|nr:hypothetical protein [Armatimonadota bacterium]
MRIISFTAMLLLASMYIAPTVSIAKGGKPVATPAKTVVIFPFVDEAKSPVEALTEDLPKSIQSELSSSGAFRAFAFSERLPSIQRALMENTLKKDDVEGPFGIEKDNVANTLKVAREMAAELILVGSIDGATADVANKKAEVTLTAVLANGRTGTPVKTIAVTGSTPDNVSATDANDLISQAAGQAVASLVKEIVPQGVVIEKPVVEKKRSSGFRKLLLPVLLGLAIGLVASSGGDDGGSSGGDAPPPVPF